MKLFNLENCLILFWVILLSSINSSYVYTLQIYQIDDFFNFSNLNFTKNKIYILLNIFRFYLPFIIFPILLIIFFKLKSAKVDFIIILFLLFFIFQLFAFFISDRFIDIPNIKLYSAKISYQKHTSMIWDSMLLITCALNALIIIAISKIKNLQIFIKKIFIISLIFIFFISFYFVFLLLSESIAENLKYIYGTNTLSPTGKTFEQASPRITGISRMLLILYFFFFCLLLTKPKKILLYIIPVILILLIYKMQARGALIGIIITLFILIFIIDINFQSKLKILFLVFLLPILLFETYYYVKNSYKYDYSKNSYKYDYSKVLNSENQKTDTSTSDRNRIISEKTTSGRVEIWQNILFIIKEKKIILGYGPQADRDLLLNFKLKYMESGIFTDKDKNRFIYDNNASNAFFYAYLSGGVMSFIILIAIYLITLKVIFERVFYQKALKNLNIFECFSILLITYLLLRGIFENSISLFSIDFLFYVLSYAYITKKNIYE